jgi:tetratricopeptide (TPR) repeat protein
LPEPFVPPPASSEIFRSPELLVKGLQRHASACCVVTFESYTDNRTLDRPGFGEVFFDANGIDAIHIIPRNNDWYQYHEIDEACRRVRALTAPYPHVVAYGQSMGGYGAIRLGGRVGAQVALAISPQFSIDPAVAPFESRWVGDAGRIDFGIERSAGHTFVAKAYVAYDPHDLDARHVELYRPHTEIVDLRLLNCGHPASGFMVDTGILQPAILGLCRGTFDIPALRAQARQARHGSAILYANLAAHCRHVPRRVRLSAKASALSPGDPSLLGQYAFTLAHAGQFDEGLAIFETARADGSINAQMRYWQSEVHLLHGDLAKAIAVAEEALALDPEASVFVDRVQKLKSLELPSEPAPPSTAPSLGGRLRALLQKPFKLGAKKA